MVLNVVNNLVGGLLGGGTGTGTGSGTGSGNIITGLPLVGGVLGGVLGEVLGGNSGGNTGGTPGGLLGGLLGSGGSGNLLGNLPLVGGLLGSGTPPLSGNPLELLNSLLNNGPTAGVGGLLTGNLIGSVLSGGGTGKLIDLGLFETGGVVALEVAGIKIGVLPQTGSVVTINGQNVLGSTGNLLDLGGVLGGKDGLLNLTGLVGENGILDLNGLLGSVLDLVSGLLGGTEDFLDDDGNVDPSKFDVAKFGTAGRDSFVIESEANTYINGYGERDTVSFTQKTDNFAMAVGNDSVVFKSNEKIYYFDNIERVEFFDATLYLDTGGGEVAGSAYRLYQAAFDRKPDAEGLKYWIGRLDSDTTTLNAVADSFIKSPEFVSTYGTEQTVSNAKYVELLYTHTLGRDYDQSGFNYWVNRLDNGQTNRGDLLAFFSESNENQARVANDIADGIWLP